MREKLLNWLLKGKKNTFDRQFKQKYLFILKCRNLCDLIALVWFIITF